MPRFFLVCQSCSTVCLLPACCPALYRIVKAASEVDDFNRATAVRLGLMPAGASMNSGQRKALLLAAPSPTTIMSLAATPVRAQQCWLRLGGCVHGGGSHCARREGCAAACTA